MYTAAGESLTVSNVPAFLAKLWALVESPATDELICWDEIGLSFHVKDQARFAKEILPLHFKHNNIASFIRQLNMYGFRKVINTEVSNLKMEKDDMEFAHQFFVKGQEHLLDYIKRKVPMSKCGSNVSASLSSSEDVTKHDDVHTVFTEVSAVKNRQDTMNVKLENLKLENEVLWREVATLRQMHMKQQQIVNKLIQFLVSMVGNNRTLSSGLKRKGPLMLGSAAIDDAADSPPPAKIPRDKATTHPYNVQSPQPSPGGVSHANATAGMVIDDVTDLLDLSVHDVIVDGAMASVAVPPVNASPASNLFTVTGGDVAPIPSSVSADSLEPLAILESGYRTSLELTDVLDSDEVVVPVEEVSIEDVLTTDVSGTESGGAWAEPAAAAISAVTNTTPTPSTSSNPLLTSSALAVSDPRPSSDFGRIDLSSHIDTTYSQLNGLRELLSCSPQISIDPNMMFDLFGLLDSNIPTPLCTEDSLSDMWKRNEDVTASTKTQLKLESNGSIVGNELVQCTTLDDFGGLYDSSDLISAYPSFFDAAEFGGVEDDSVLSPGVINDDVIHDMCLATPKPLASVGGGGGATKHSGHKPKKEMEDVD